MDPEWIPVSLTGDMQLVSVDDAEEVDVDSVISDDNVKTDNNVKRDKHNWLERQRRNEMTQFFEELRDACGSNDSKVSRKNILKMAINHIKYAKENRLNENDHATSKGRMKNSDRVVQKVQAAEQKKVRSAEQFDAQAILPDPVNFIDVPNVDVTNHFKEGSNPERYEPSDMEEEEEEEEEEDVEYVYDMIQRKLVKKKTIAKTCIVGGCKTGPKDGVTLFDYPVTDLLTLRKWKTFVKNSRRGTEDDGLRNFQICALHFDVTNMTNYPFWRASLSEHLTLRKGAVPTVMRPSKDKLKFFSRKHLNSLPDAENLTRFHATAALESLKTEQSKIVLDDSENSQQSVDVSENYEELTNPYYGETQEPGEVVNSPIPQSVDDMAEQGLIRKRKQTYPYSVTITRNSEDEEFGFAVYSDDSSNICKIGAIREGTAAAEHSDLHVGDRVLSVNGVAVRDVSHRLVLNVIKHSKLEVTLVIGEPAADDEGSNLAEITSSKQQAWSSEMLHKLLTMQQRSTLCDAVIIASNGKQVRAHIAVLEAAYPRVLETWKGKWRRNKSSAKSPHYELRSAFTFEVAEIIVNFAYTGKVIVREEILAEVENAFQQLQVLSVLHVNCSSGHQTFQAVPRKMKELEKIRIKAKGFKRSSDETWTDGKEPVVKIRKLESIPETVESPPKLKELIIKTEPTSDDESTPHKSPVAKGMHEGYSVRISGGQLSSLPQAESELTVSNIDFKVEPSNESESTEDAMPELSSDVNMTTRRTKRYPCKICGKDYTSLSMLVDHVNWRHKTGGEKFVCDICCDILQGLEYLRSHLKKHGPQGEVVLKKMELEFPSKTVREYLGKPPISYNKPMPKSEKQRLQLAKNINRPMPKSVKNRLKVARLSLQSALTANKGGHTFVHKSLGQANSSYNHSYQEYVENREDTKEREVLYLNDKKGATAEEKSLYACGDCEKICFYRASLKEHLYSHYQKRTTPELTCICGKTHLTKSALESHFFLHNEQKLLFVCKLCKQLTKGNYKTLEHAQSHALSSATSVTFSMMKLASQGITVRELGSHPVSAYTPASTITIPVKMEVIELDDSDDDGDDVIQLDEETNLKKDLSSPGLDVKSTLVTDGSDTTSVKDSAETLVLKCSETPQGENVKPVHLVENIHSAGEMNATPITLVKNESISTTVNVGNQLSNEIACKNTSFDEHNLNDSDSNMNQDSFLITVNDIKEEINDGLSVVQGNPPIQN